MDDKLSSLVDALESLKETIKAVKIDENGFKRYGWNQVHLHQSDIQYFIINFINKLNSYGDAKITEGLDSVIEHHIGNINNLNNTAKQHFTNNANHLLHMVPNIILTLHTIFSDVEYELFSYENIQDKKLLPRGLATRLRSTDTQLKNINDAAGDLEKKISVINQAHEAAESLPTDLESLKEAKAELTKLIATASRELTQAKKHLADIKEDAKIITNGIQKSSEKTEEYEKKANKSADLASKLVEECDEALQITTTQGLAAGFDQKAKELRNSIWIWIVGLLIALGLGAWLGAERVEAFSLALDNNLSSGQAILHTLMSIFSIGGPLWLAWISTQQINQRFKLSEDYSYKATVAKSFTGFKKLAERFDPSTEERLFNSTLDRFDEMPLRLVEAKDYSSPWHEFLDSESFKKAIDAVPTLAQEAGRFAGKVKLKNKAIKPKRKKVSTIQPEESVSDE